MNRVIYRSGEIATDVPGVGSGDAALRLIEEDWHVVAVVVETPSGIVAVEVEEQERT